MFLFVSPKYIEKKERKKKMKNLFDKWLKYFLCVVVVAEFLFEDFENEKKNVFSLYSFFPSSFIFAVFSSPRRPSPASFHHPPLRSSIFLIIFVVDGKTFNLKASLLHPSLCIRILHLNVIIFFSLLHSRERYWRYIIFSTFFFFFLSVLFLKVS